MKKKIAFVIFFLMLYSSFSFGYEISDYGRQVIVENYSVVPEKPYPGDTVTLAVDLKNRGSYYAVTDVNAKITLPSEFEAIEDFTYVKGINAQSSITVFFKFKIKENVPYGTYQIPLEVNYLREKSKLKRRDSFNIPIDVYKRVKLNIENIEFEKKLHLKDNLNIKVKIKNVGNSEVRNINIKLSSSSTNLANFVPLSKTNFYIKSLEINKTANAEFKLYIPENITPGVYNFIIEVTADDADTESETINVEVKGKPNIIISGTDFTIEGRRGKKIYPHDLVTIALQLDNIGEETAKAVKVKAKFEKGFVAAETSYVGNIDADDSGTAIFDVAVGNVSEGSHNIKFEIEYLDEEGNLEKINTETQIVTHKMPETPLWILLIEIIVILVIVYFIVKQILAYLSIKKVNI